MSRVLVIGDTHLPFAIENYIGFLKKVHTKYNCNKVVHIGDLVDQHAISLHEREPDSLGAESEKDLAIKQISQLAKAFPKVTLTMGNHDLRVYRVAGKKAGVPLSYMKNFNELYVLPDTWELTMETYIDDVLYKHGEGYSGVNGARNAAIDARMSTVIGHLHSHAGIAYLANRNDLIFGMNVGCLIDIKSYSMRYGTSFRYKPTIGCGVVIDGKPYYEYMSLGKRVTRTEK